MDALEASILLLETDRAALLHQLALIDAALASERARHAQLRNQAAPIHRLPNELLALLFALTHASLRSTHSSRADLDALRFLVETSRVCTRWRHVILRTPLLWNTLPMAVDPGFHTNLPAQEYLLAHLRRSADAYLDLVLFIQTPDHNDVDFLFSIVGKHSHRWRRVSIEMGSANIRLIQTHLESLDTPLLKHFSLNIWETTDSGPTSPRTCYPTILPTIFCKGAPNLSVLRLANAALGNLHPNSTSISTLHLGGWSQAYFTWTQFKALLESLPHLENLSLHELCIRHYAGNPLNVPSAIHVPNLRCLRLHKPFTPVHQIMPLLTFPLLEQVSLHDLEFFECPPISTVTYLRIQGCPFDYAQSEQLSAAFPNIQHLSMDECAYHMYEVLRPGEEGSAVWRSLHTLAVRNLVAKDLGVFVNMVGERKGLETPMSMVRMDKRSRTVLRQKHRWDQLAEQATVVVDDAAESWPPGLGYDDPHDLVLP